MIPESSPGGLISILTLDPTLQHRKSSQNYLVARFGTSLGVGEHVGAESGGHGDVATYGPTSIASTFFPAKPRTGTPSIDTISSPKPTRFLRFPGGNTVSVDGPPHYRQVMTTSTNATCPTMTNCVAAS